jgi:pimeloyl-ACP methyl ester carboxylesterase
MPKENAMPQENWMPQTALVLHGGGGPVTVTPLVTHLATSGYEVGAPTHPGWDGTNIVPGDTMASLAARYLEQLRAQGARSAVLVGSSIGGWLALEMAALDATSSEPSIAAVIVIDSVGIEVPGEPVTDIFALDPARLAEYSWANPELAPVASTPATPEKAAIQRGNLESLRRYAGQPYMHDPSLARRLGDITANALVLWGDSDGIATPTYGRALASLIPGARFRLVENAGHLPQLEQPDATMAAIDEFLDSRTRKW